MPEPKGALDTTVNGPEGLPAFDGDAWEQVDWRHHEEQVRRLRGRIFQAARDGDWPRVRSLQKLMLRSWSSTLVSVRQVTQRNAGRGTAGIDGLVALTSQARAEMAVRVHAGISSHRPSPVRRVHVPTYTPPAADASNQLSGGQATPRHASAPKPPRVACLGRVRGRPARTVLRGPRCSNAPGLPGESCRAGRGGLPGRWRRVAGFWSVVVRGAESCRAGGGEFPHDGGFSVLSRGQLSVLRELSAGQAGSLRGGMNRG